VEARLVRVAAVVLGHGTRSDGHFLDGFANQVFH
jgi:hypothetical protein